MKKVLLVTLIVGLLFTMGLVFIPRASAYPTGWSADGDTGRDTEVDFDVDSYGSTIALAFIPKPGDSGAGQVCILKSEDSGATWPYFHGFGVDADATNIQVVLSSLDSCYVFWTSGTTSAGGPGTIYIERTTNFSADTPSWTQSTDAAAVYSRLSVDWRSNGPHAAWDYNHADGIRIFMTNFSGGARGYIHDMRNQGMQNETTQIIDVEHCYAPAIACSGNMIYVVYRSRYFVRSDQWYEGVRISCNDGIDPWWENSWQGGTCTQSPRISYQRDDATYDMEAIKAERASTDAVGNRTITAAWQEDGASYAGFRRSGIGGIQAPSVGSLTALITGANSVIPTPQRQTTSTWYRVGDKRSIVEFDSDGTRTTMAVYTTSDFGNFYIARQWNSSTAPAHLVWRDIGGGGHLKCKYNDTTNPSGSLDINPPAGSTLYSGRYYMNVNPTFTATVSDNWGYTGNNPPGAPSDYFTDGVTRVNFTGGTATVPKEEPPWSVAVEIPTASNKTIAASCMDTAGNTATLSGSFNVYKDLTAPDVAVSGFGAGNIYTEGGQPVLYTNADTPMNFTASDNLNFTVAGQFTNGVTSITLQRSPNGTDGWTNLANDEVTSGTATIDNAPWSKSLNIRGSGLTGLVDGTYYLRGVATDIAGNQSATVVRKVVVDTAIPTIEESHNTEPNEAGWRNQNTTVTLTGADANLPDDGGCQYELSGTPMATSNTRSVSSYTPYSPPLVLESGTWTVKYRCVDKAGNPSAVGTKTFKVDTIHPTGSIERPAPDEQLVKNGFTDKDNYRIEGTAADNNQLVWAAIYVNGKMVGDPWTKDFDKMYADWDITGLPKGDYTIEVRAKDIAGNWGGGADGTPVASKTIVVDDVATDWYFAEGNTLAAFDQWLCIQNPGDKTAEVDANFMLETGEVITKKLSIPSHSRETYDVKTIVPQGHVGVSTHLHVTNKQGIVAERPMYFNYKQEDPNVNWKGGHIAVGLNAPQKTFYFAEGCTYKNSQESGSFDEWITIQNPGNAVANIAITYMLGNGQNIEKAYQVKPHSRETISVNADVGDNQDVSTKVVSDVPVVAERPMYFKYHNTLVDGHNIMGASGPAKNWYFAEGATQPGFQEWLTIQNPSGAEATVKVEYLTGNSAEKMEFEKKVPPFSRQTVNVNKDVGFGKNVSMNVTSDVPIVAERPMYFTYQDKWDGGHVAMGSNSEKLEYYIAEGTTLSGLFDTWYTIGNPNTKEATVTVTFMFEGGRTMDKAYKIPPTSRVTVNVNEEVGPNQNVSSHIETDMDITIERPMYFNYKGQRCGGSDAPAYPVN